MGDARDNILQRIRKANQKLPQADALEIVEQRLRRHARGPQPAWQENTITRFTQKVEQSAASYERVKTADAITNAVTAYLENQSLKATLVCAGTPLLGQLQWPDNLAVEVRTATTHDKVVLTEAYAGIAETGSVVMCSGKESPVSLNFLPDHFICVMRASRVVERIEDIWEQMRREGISMPRAINVITGPSRTADVEQIIQMGAHGPRKVHLLLLDEGKQA